MTNDKELRLLRRIDEMLFTDNGPNPYESGKDIQQSRIERLIADNQKMYEGLAELATPGRPRRLARGLVAPQEPKP